MNSMRSESGQNPTNTRSTHTESINLIKKNNCTQVRRVWGGEAISTATAFGYMPLLGSSPSYESRELLHVNLLSSVGPESGAVSMDPATGTVSIPVAPTCFPNYAAITHFFHYSKDDYILQHIHSTTRAAGEKVNKEQENFFQEHWRELQRQHSMPRILGGASSFALPPEPAVAEPKRFLPRLEGPLHLYVSTPCSSSSLKRKYLSHVVHEDTKYTPAILESFLDNPSSKLPFLPTARLDCTVTALPRTHLRALADLQSSFLSCMEVGNTNELADDKESSRVSAISSPSLTSPSHSLSPQQLSLLQSQKVEVVPTEVVEPPIENRDIKNPDSEKEYETRIDDAAILDNINYVLFPKNEEGCTGNASTNNRSTEAEGEGQASSVTEHEGEGNGRDSSTVENSALVNVKLSDIVQPTVEDEEKFIRFPIVADHVDDEESQMPDA